MNAMSVAFFAVCSALFWNVYLKKLITRKIICEICVTSMIDLYGKYILTILSQISTENQLEFMCIQ